MTIRIKIPNVLRSAVFQDIASGLMARVLPGIASIISVPILIHALGPERYTAIGVFLTIQLLSGLLEIGFTTGITRQAAWLTGMNASADKFAPLLRSFEIPYFVIATAVTTVGITLGQAILTGAFRIHPQAIDLDRQAVIFMFAFVGIRLPFQLYVSYLSGRRKIQQANLIFLAMEMLRIVGAVSLVVWIGPLLAIFFGWQLFIAIVAVVTAYFASWRITSTGNTRVSPDWRSILDNRGLMVGASQMSILFIVANSLDKLFLPRFVSAADYGLYVATGQLAIGIHMIVQPVWAAFNPRLLNSFAAKDFRRTQTVFQAAAGLITGLCCAFMFVITIGGPSILHLWLGTTEASFYLALVALCAGHAMAAQSLLALTVHQAASRYFPTPLIFVIAIIAVPIVAFLALHRIDATSVAIIWSVVCLVEFIGSALAFRLYAPGLALSWLGYVLAPFALTMIIGPLIALWTQVMPMRSQLILAIFGGSLVALLVAATNPATRDWLRRHLVDGPD